MAFGDLTKAFLTLPIIWFAVANAQSPAPAQKWNTTTPTEDYVIEKQRIYASVIVSYETQLEAFRKGYKEQLDTVAQQTTMIEDKLQEVDEKLNPLVLLDELSKHCVQKYRGQIPTVESVKASLNSCILSAQNAVNTFITAPDATMRSLTNYYNGQLKASLADCAKKNPSPSLNYTLCVTKVINSADSVTINNRRTFATQMTQSRCSSESRIKQAVDCVFTILYNTIATIGEVLRLIDNCTAGLETCPPCATPSPTESSCENVLKYKLKASDFRNATINNPFYGLNSNIPCLQINFD